MMTAGEAYFVYNGRVLKLGTVSGLKRLAEERRKLRRIRILRSVLRKLTVP